MKSGSLFYNKKSSISAESFQKISAKAVVSIQKCIRIRVLRSCVYDKEVTATSAMVEVHTGIYHPFIKDWMQHFPDMKIVRLEDYKTHRESVIRDITSYLELVPHVALRKEASEITNKGPSFNISMLPETRQMLDEFYKPFNRMLADLLQDQSFAFNT